MKNLYGTIEISDKAVRASQNDVGAFVNLLNAEMEGLVKASSFNFGRMLYGDGTGVLATVVGDEGSNVVKVDSVKNLYEGMVIDVLLANGTNSTVTGRRIIAVNRASQPNIFSFMLGGLRLRFLFRFVVSCGSPSG